MATKANVRLLFDPDLPLFKSEVEGHIIEVYFIGHKSKANTWLVTIDAEGFEYETLMTAFMRTSQIVNRRYSTDIRFFIPFEAP